MAFKREPVLVVFGVATMNVVVSSCLMILIADFALGGSSF
jgi:hypothetical protein